MATEIISGKLHISYGEFFRSCARSSVSAGRYTVPRLKKTLTGVKCWLEGGKTVVFEHVKESLRENTVPRSKFTVSSRCTETRPTVFPALSRPRNRILAFLLRRPVATERQRASRRHPCGHRRNFVWRQLTVDWARGE